MRRSLFCDEAWRQNVTFLRNFKIQRRVKTSRYVPLHASEGARKYSEQIHILSSTLVNFEIKRGVDVVVTWCLTDVLTFDPSTRLSWLTRSWTTFSALKKFLQVSHLEHWSGNSLVELLILDSSVGKFQLSRLSSMREVSDAFRVSSALSPALTSATGWASPSWARCLKHTESRPSPLTSRRHSQEMNLSFCCQTFVITDV